MKSERRSRSRSPMDDRRDSSRDRSRSPRRTRIPTSKRVVVSNIPYDLKWQEVKDLFRREVGDTMYVELFNGPDGKPKGMGVIEFKDIDTAALAIEKMHRFEVKDRKIVVREERERERRQNEAQSSRGGGGGGGGGAGGRGMGNMGQGVMGPGPGMRMGGGGHNINTGMSGAPAISPVVLQQLGIDGPVTNTVFISNLDYSVGWKKLKDVFKLAGNVVRAEIKEDKDGKSRGMGTVTFETPAEAVQAISMFNSQSLFDRTMRVKMDGQSSAASRPESLPSGLKSVGPTLNNLQMNSMDMNMGMGSNMGMGGMGMNDGMRGVGMGSGMSGMAGGMTGMGGGMSGMGGGMTGMGSAMGGSSMNNSMGMGGMSGGMGSMGTGMGMSDTFSGMSSMSGMGSSNSSSIGMGGGMSDSFSGMSSMGMGGGNSYSGMIDSSRSSGMGMSSRTSDFGRNMNDRSGGGGSSSLASGDMRTRADKSTIIVKNLPYSMDWQTLKTKFSNVGDIRFAEISKDDRGKSQGWGLISFRREEDARIAVQKMNRVNLDGRDVVVKMLN